MWRSSLSVYSKLLASTNPKSKSTFLFSEISSSNYGFERSVSYSTSSTSPSSPDALKLGFPKLDRIRSSGFASSVATIDAPSLAGASASRAKDVADLALHYGWCYWELSKARLSMLVVATSGAGYVLGSGNAIDYVGLCCTCAGTMMVAASANSLNQVFEINNDAKMKRTKHRPLPSGRITVAHAVSWASSVGAAGTALLACQANALAAGLAASNLFLYAFVYTPLKQIHPVNTWVGAVVGAIPPLLGWAAASGQVSLNGMILPAALYFWQIPHFMALAYLCRDDYAVGGFRMFSLADVSGERTALVALRNCIYLIPLGYLAYDWGITSGWFCLESTVLALAISGTALSFYLNRTTKNARRMFHASLLYLPVFMSGLLFHRLSDDQQLRLEEDSHLLLSSGTLAEETEINRRKKVNRSAVSARGQPPVAYASVAPFPFLPAPNYAAI
ncbi:Protoheme IX farnesyltransferase, mitochondrial [Sarracenia purpurea var. burkii]